MDDVHFKMDGSAGSADGGFPRRIVFLAIAENFKMIACNKLCPARPEQCIVGKDRFYLASKIVIRSFGEMVVAFIVHKRYPSCGYYIETIPVH